MIIKETPVSQSRWSDETIFDLVRKIRNDLIKDFLDERHLRVHVAEKFNLKELSPVKIEFMKNALKDLLISPVNPVHYEGLIRKIRETDSASLAEGNEQLFYKEIDNIIKKYIYEY